MQGKLASSKFSVLISHKSEYLLPPTTPATTSLELLPDGELQSALKLAGACFVVCLSRHWCWESLSNSRQTTPTVSQKTVSVFVLWSTLGRWPEVWHLRTLHVLVVGCNLYFITATNKVSSFIRIVITNLHRNQSLHEWDDIDGQDNY